MTPSGRGRRPFGTDIDQAGAESSAIPRPSLPSIQPRIRFEGAAGKLSVKPPIAGTCTGSASSKSDTESDRPESGGVGEDPSRECELRHTSRPIPKLFWTVDR